MNNLILSKYVSKRFFSISCVLTNQLRVKSCDCNHQLFDSVHIRNFFTGKTNYQNISKKNSYDFKSKTTRNYAVATVVLTLGLTWAAVPLYGIFCRMTGYGGTTQHDLDAGKLQSVKKNNKRLITVKFNSDTAANMAWKFKPQQQEIKVYLGETALAFYTATNPTDKPIVGISTYNVIPFDAGPYFNKIQCFCFEEQLLNPHEQVDMPVFFYIDPEFAEDPKMEYVDEIVLSYTFFEAKENLKLPIPFFFKKA